MIRVRSSNTGFTHQNSLASLCGYTIVETMIFLAVSGVMFLSAMLFLGGQQRKNEFATGVRDLQSQLDDIMNDVSTGFYDKSQLTCHAPDSGGKPDIAVVAVGAEEQGTSSSCTFVGRAIQFAPDGEDETAILYTLVGRRQTKTSTGGATDVSTLAEAEPTQKNMPKMDMRLPYGIKIKKITYNAADGSVPDVGTIAFVTRYGENSGSGGITGTQDIDLIAVSSTSLGNPIFVGEKGIEEKLNTSTRNPSKGIKLCFLSGGTNQHANIIIGGPGRQISTELIIGTGQC